MYRKGQTVLLRDEPHGDMLVLCIVTETDGDRVTVEPVDKRSVIWGRAVVPEILISSVEVRA